jgi:S-DNA-T family DNA segregation ATPase FtsK/SpoIIIE
MGTQASALPHEPAARTGAPSPLRQDNNRSADEQAASEIEGRGALPGWQSAFTLAPNVRFSRTPEAALTRRLPEPPADRRRMPEVVEAPAPVATVETKPAPQTPVRADMIPSAPVVPVAPPAPNALRIEAPAVQAEPATIPQHLQPLGARAITYRLRRELEQKPLVATPSLIEPAPQPGPEQTVVVAPEPVVSPAAPSAPPRAAAFLSDHVFWEALDCDFREVTGTDAAAREEPETAPVSVVEVQVKEAIVTAPVPGPARAVFEPLSVRVAAGLPASYRSVPEIGPYQPPLQERDWPVTALYREIAVRKAGAAIALDSADLLPTLDAPAAEAAMDAAPIAIDVPDAHPVILAQPVVRAEEGEGEGEGEYQLPPIDLLQVPPEQETTAMTPEALEQSAGLLESVLEDFGIKGEIIDVRPGPVVTLYEFEPAPGVKSSRVIGLSDDIARSMSALSARVAVVPGRNVIGIELPNPVRETVYFRELIESRDYAESRFHLPVCLGKTIGGEPVIAELSKMPHLLVAGTTGSGKSVAINTMILSLLYRLKPEECRLIMVDPKMLELSVYDGIPHLLTPVVTDPKKAVMALKWAVREMEERYKKMSRLGVRNIDGYNTRAAAARAKGETIMVSVQSGFDRQTGELLYVEEEMDLTAMPYIVVIVDEMADLMMVAGKEIEGAIQRLAQMARAAGIHLIMATQRPSVDVITGTIKANFPTRISFQVTSKIDSRTILGEPGAEHLLGQGDMLHMMGGGRIARVHGPFVSDQEVEKVVAHLKTQGRPEYLGTVTEDAEEAEDAGEEDAAVFDKSAMGEEDASDLYEKAVKLVLRDKKCSTSYIQRRLGVGYNRAASLVERMEQEGLVGPANHVGKRSILSGTRDTPDMSAIDSEY